MSMTPDQQRKKADAQEESLRHLRYSQADGKREVAAEMNPDTKEKVITGGEHEHVR